MKIGVREQVRFNGMHKNQHACLSEMRYKTRWMVVCALSLWRVVVMLYAVFSVGMHRARTDYYTVSYSVNRLQLWLKGLQAQKSATDDTISCIDAPLPSMFVIFFFFSSRRRHTRFDCDWSSDVCSSD